MKRWAILGLTVILLTQQIVPAHAVEDMVDIKDRIECGTDFAQQEESFQALLQKKANERNGVMSYAGGPGLVANFGMMPSTGTVRILVLPIEFKDYKIEQSVYDRMESYFFAEDDPAKDNYDISTKALLQRLSYGKLNLVGDILPVYTASENREVYDRSVTRFENLVSEALSSYFDDDPSRSYSDYDSDGDGYLDALFIKYAGPSSAGIKYEGSYGSNSFAGSYALLVAQRIPINDEFIKTRCYAVSSAGNRQPSVAAHELLHCMGLLDTYIANVLEDPFAEVMSGGAAHLNVFYRYLLGWVDPIILTSSDSIGEITVQTADWHGGELDEDTPRAVVYIPENKGLPVTEFYMAEYRSHEKYEDWFLNQPGIILWHCDSEQRKDGSFIHARDYLKPVYRSGGTPNILGKIEFMKDDFYVEGSVFSPETTPNSNFYDDVYTGIYMEVKELQKEYAVLNTGFLQAHTHEYSAGWKSDGTSHWHECECGDKKDTAAHTPMEDKAVEPTCTAPGKTAGSHCSECGYVITAQTEVSATGHSYSSEWSKDAVNHWHTCTKCDDKKDTAAHTEDGGTVTKQPTLEEAGVRTFSCSVCGYKLREEAIAKLEPSHEHSYSPDWKSDETSHWHECECGDKKDSASHTWDGGSVTTAPTTDTAGTRTYSCTVCGQTRTESIPATGGGSIPSGGGGGSSAPTRYSITVEKDLTGGSVTASASRAEQGDKVTLTVRAQEGYTLEEVEVKDGKGKEVTLTRESGGRYTFTMPGSKVTVTARFAGKPKEEKPPEDTPGKIEKPPLPFADVKENAWYYDAVAEVYGKGWMTGLKETEFGPETPASRGTVVQVLYQMEGEPSAGGNSYSDVADSKYYAPAVAWAMANGLVKGYGDGSFRPDRAVTREELAAILYRYGEYKGQDMAARADLSGFTDAGQISGYAREPLAWAKAQGFISGTDWGGIHPGGYATRAETAAIFTRFSNFVFSAQ